MNTDYTEIDLNVLRSLASSLERDVIESKKNCQELRIKSESLRTKKEELQKILSKCADELPILKRIIFENLKQGVNNASNRLEVYQRESKKLKSEAPQLKSYHAKIESLENTRNQLVQKVSILDNNSKMVQQNLQLGLQKFKDVEKNMKIDLKLLQNKLRQEDHYMNESFQTMISKLECFEYAIEDLIKISQLVKN